MPLQLGFVGLISEAPSGTVTPFAGCGINVLSGLLNPQGKQ
ncbi:hypothetical protein EC12741_0720 [Escherichia coli 1.2741]|nr:hypothetical protein ECSTEC7V_3343 [Escherichia coli STEC_7v]EIG79009.1 hypothetical protein EC12741_0720 [Escherichia coli 1.2741]